MDDTIFYDENLFYLNEIINTIEHGFRLAIQPQLFSNKIVEDIFFVQTTLSELHRVLMDNELMIQRSEQLRRLLRTKSRFIEVLESAVRQENPLTADLSPIIPRFQELMSEQQGQVSEIREILRAATNGTLEETDLVSEQEFRFLLMEENSEEPA